MTTPLEFFVSVTSFINAFGSDFVLDAIDSESDEADEEHADHTHESRSISATPHGRLLQTNREVCGDPPVIEDTSVCVVAAAVTY